MKLECWNDLHGKNVADVPVDVIRASIHLERDKPSKPVWLAWQAPATIPSNLEVNARVIWQAYVHRWPVEPGIRFRKQRLGWTTPQFQHKESGDRWSWLVAAGEAGLALGLRLLGLCRQEHRPCTDRSCARLVQALTQSRAV